MSGRFSLIRTGNYRRLLSKWGSSRTILKNMVVMVTGAVASRLIVAASTPLVTRLYEPEHFGVLSVFHSVITLLSPLGTLSYSLALPLVRKVRTLTIFSILCLVILIVTSCVIWILTTLFGDRFVAILQMGNLSVYLWLIPIGFIGIGLYEVLNQWAISQKAFSEISATRLFQGLGSSAVKITLGLFGIKPLGLLLGEIALEAGGVFSLGRLWLKTARLYYRRATLRRLAIFFFRFKEFPLIRLPSHFLLLFAVRAPVLYCAWLFGADTTGNFGFALTILTVPVDLVARTIGQVYYGEVSGIGKKKPREIYKITIKIATKLLALSIPCVSLLALFTPTLFCVVFGNKWIEAGRYAQIMLLYLVPQLICIPFINVLNVFERNLTYLKVHIIRGVTVLVIFLGAFFLKLGPKTTITLLSLGMAGYYLYVFFEIILMLRREIEKLE